MMQQLTEKEFQKQITDLAEMQGWWWMHIVRCPTNRGDSWRTASIGPLGKGWPDLVLAKGARLLFIEVKDQKGTLAHNQQQVLDVLRDSSRVHVWRPSDWPLILETLAAS